MAEPSSNQTAWERWELASFDEAAKKAMEPPPPPPEEVEVPAPEVHLPTAEEIEQIYQQAREEGQRQGHEEGHKAGYEEGQAKARGEAKRFAQIAAKLDKGLAEMESAVADELLSLSIALARDVIRQELTAHPETLLVVVREALGQLPHQHAAIYLHPDDASLLRSYAGDQLSHAGHRIHEDFKLKRGDCLLEAGGTQVDATVAMRWQRVLEGLGITAAWEDRAEAGASVLKDDEPAAPE
ncbi:MAG: flagellar assembly protein FliH [Rhodocyclaceae bacterium]|nr:flagellar assembly protein FliH [Rhodocyclaceae bacterium]MDZ4215254.1 flagellar assembly protein FliH [Rhodocyclaceae bacterium]